MKGPNHGFQNALAAIPLFSHVLFPVHLAVLGVERAIAARPAPARVHSVAAQFRAQLSLIS
jgi:hypothetical protein